MIALSEQPQNILDALAKMIGHKKIDLRQGLYSQTGTNFCVCCGTHVEDNQTGIDKLMAVFSRPADGGDIPHQFRADLSEHTMSVVVPDEGGFIKLMWRDE